MLSRSYILDRLIKIASDEQAIVNEASRFIEKKLNEASSIDQSIKYLTSVRQTSSSDYLDLINRVRVLRLKTLPQLEDEIYKKYSVYITQDPQIAEKLLSAFEQVFSKVNLQANPAADSVATPIITKLREVSGD